MKHEHLGINPLGSVSVIAEQIRRPIARPSIRVRYAELMVALAQTQPGHINFVADAHDLDDRAEHITAVGKAFAQYIEELIDDTSCEVECTGIIDRDAPVFSRYLDTISDLSGRCPASRRIWLRWERVVNVIHEGDEAMNITARTVARGDVTDSVFLKCDLSRLTADERTQYYVQLCQSMGLNPHTQPFAFLTLNGKLTLYAKRDAADQLRKINGISIEDHQSQHRGRCYSPFTCARRMPAIEPTRILGLLRFRIRSRARRAQYRSSRVSARPKRRVTLSISGLGFFFQDETGGR